MNADAYLRKQGWKGSGHSLDSTGRGIKKPLLIAHKQDQLGLGKKKAAYTTDDQWWMRAFDQSLQSIGTGKESTLSQIRTQGINRGGLYGFFVKGEAIAGTIEDSSATDASTPSSGTSTPPTSSSDTAAPARTANMSAKENKRKRSDTTVSGASKKAKTALVQPKVDVAQEETLEPEHQDAVAAKLAKLTPSERTEYETRAAAKDQTLEQYVLRRIHKKAGKRASEHVEPSDPPLFFTDLEGDADLLTPAPAPISYTPLPSGRCPLDPTIWEGRDLDSLPKPVRRAQREYLRQQRLEKRFATALTEKEQETFMTRALVKMRVEPGKATDEQREEARVTAKKMMRAGKSGESKRKPVKKNENKNETTQTANVTYTPLPNGSCPVDPTIWEGHLPKALPRPVREARHHWIVEQRLAKKRKAAEGRRKKDLIGLTKAEKRLLRKQALEDQGLDSKLVSTGLWGKEQMKAKRLLKKQEKKEKREQFEQKGTRKHKQKMKEKASARN